MSTYFSIAPFAVKCALLHLLVCMLVVMLAISMVFFLWYPPYLAPIVGVGKILVLLVVVDVVCGPLLTVFLAKPTKSRRELRLDLTLVGAVQVGALVFGLWSLYGARPVALAFEVDRFVVVTANQIQPEPLDRTIAHLIRKDDSGLQLVSLREPKSSIEYLESLDQSMQGITPAMRPSWWRPLGEAHQQIEAKAKLLTYLINKRPEQARELQKAARQTGIPVENLRYLPLVSSRSLEWIALLDMADNIVGRANIDGFE
ncbi:MAG: hypothetical protein Q8M80_01745 [Hydrogenophaga sp.]|nr:hypothetical protein [Hydrogenophaga sp.]